MKKFIIKSIDRKFEFMLVDNSGSVDLKSVFYDKKFLCDYAISLIKLYSHDISKYCIKKSTGDEYYYELSSVKGYLLCRSKLYDSKALCVKGIMSLRSCIFLAPVEDHCK